MGNPLGRLPTDFTESDEYVDLEGMNNLLALARAMQNMRGADGVTITISAGGVTVSGRRGTTTVPAAAPPDVVQVRVKLSGGDAGSSSMPCSWKYNIWAKDEPSFSIDAALALNVSVVGRQWKYGSYDAASDNTFGEAYKHGDTWYLTRVYAERKRVKVCDPSPAE